MKEYVAVIICIGLVLASGWAYKKFGPKRSSVRYIDLPDYVEQKGVVARQASLPIVPDLVIPAIGARPIRPGEYFEASRELSIPADLVNAVSASLSGGTLSPALAPTPPSTTREPERPTDSTAIYRALDRAPKVPGSNGSSSNGHHG